MGDRSTSVARLSNEPEQLSKPSRLILVANRLPFRMRRTPDGLRAEPSPGGLATAVGPFARTAGARWIGTAGDAAASTDPDERQRLADALARENCGVVELPGQVAEGFYGGFSNRTLWPLFHGFTKGVQFDPDAWANYVDANLRFRDAVLAEAQPDDTVWVHDYHLMLLPQLLREALPNAAIGFFLHIPFPASDAFRILPPRAELLLGVLGATLIGFQTHRHLQHFRSSVTRVLGVHPGIDRVRREGREARLTAMPVGIAPEVFLRHLAPSGRARRHLTALRTQYEGKRILLAVDRLDYTKGIPERLRAFRTLLRSTPALRGQVVLIQVAVPTRETVPEYAELSRGVHELIGEVNGEFGTVDWVPVVYIHHPISRPELVALYASADVGWVTPLVDGMNLVAKEYVACHANHDGVLVLSEFAGAAEEMGEALIVNPYDEAGVAQTVERALAMPAEEQRERMRALHRRVMRGDALHWGTRFIDELQDASCSAVGPTAELVPSLPVDEMVASFRRAGHRALLLDYDGTLVPLARHPRDASPSEELLRLLGHLSADPNTDVAIVSGRPRKDLERWLGSVPGLALFAEHGALARLSGSSDWELLARRPVTDWKPLVLPVLEQVADRTPGSFVEEKEFSVVWHYRLSDPEVGEWQANELIAMLGGMLADTEIVASRGNRTVELRVIGAEKTTVAERLRLPRPGRAFLLAAGDDETDEDLFEQLRLAGDGAWTVRVGDGATAARYRLPSPRAMLKVLRLLGNGAP